LRHKLLKTFEQSASVDDYHWELPRIPYLGATSVADRLKCHDEGVLYASDLSVGDDVRHMADFKGRYSTEADITSLTFRFAHHPKNRLSVETKSVAKCTRLSYVIEFLCLTLKQAIYSFSLRLRLEQRLVERKKLCPLNLEALYSHLSTIFYTTLLIDDNTLSCYPLGKSVEDIANGRMGKAFNCRGS